MKRLLLSVLVFGLLTGCGKKAVEADAAPAPSSPTPPPTEASDAAPGPDAGPSAADATAADTAVDPNFRATRPAASEPTPLTLPSITPFKLGNGLEVFLVPTALPTLSMTFEFDVGVIDDPDDALGLASACLDLFSEGTERLDKVAWSEALADHAVSIYSPAGFETSTIVVRALASKLGPALDLFAEMMNTPGLRQDDLSRILDDRRAALAQSRGTPAGIAQRLLGAVVWGKDHPYGRIQQMSHIDNITLDRCRALVTQLKPSGARLWVVGQVAREDLTRELESRLATWTGEAPKRREVPPAATPNGRIHAVHVPGAVQSVIVVGYPGPARAADDFEATSIMAQIFGGSFSSRVNMNLREDKGYAYGARGGFTYRRGGSHLSVSASVEVTTTALALAEVAKETRIMRESPPKEEELVRERDGALQALPARFAKPSSTLDELRTLHYFGLPLDWYSGHDKRLAALTVDAIHEAAKKHLPESQLVVLVVGDLDQKEKAPAPAKPADPANPANPAAPNPPDAADAPPEAASGRTVREALKQLADDKVFGDGGLVFLDADGEILP